MLTLIALFACTEAAPPPPPAEPPAPAGPTQADDDALRAQFGALPAVMEHPTEPVTPEKVELGRLLYYDVRLSKNHDVACNSCHLLDQYGVDSQPTSTGHKAQVGGRNAPTVYNAALHTAQFWDGRAADVEAQAKGPVLNPIEMAMPSEEAVLTVLKSVPGYADKFTAAFPGQPEPITYDNMAKAIGAFERTLVTPSRFDKWLAGDATALTTEERAGLDTFSKSGCTACHSGVGLGGGSYQKVGAVKPYPSDDTGRFQVTQQESDKFLFKVPSLRNIDKTGPYFHDGKVATLEEAVKTMGAIQLGKDLTDAEVTSIVTFLKSATGELPADKIAKPEPLPSGPNTPKPDPS